jgi:hypothetical protein
MLKMTEAAVLPAVNLNSNLWIQMNFYLNPDGPANHMGSNTRVNAYNMAKMEDWNVKITRND